MRYFNGKKKIIYILGGMLILFLLILLFKNESIYIIRSSFSPREMIEKSLNIELPQNSEIISYTYNKEGAYYGAKVSVESIYKNDIEEQLIIYFKHPFSDGYYSEYYSDKIPNFTNVYPWWDLTEEETEENNLKFIKGGIVPRKVTPFSYTVWVFVSKDIEEKFYLYIYGTGIQVLYPEVYNEYN